MHNNQLLKCESLENTLTINGLTACGTLSLIELALSLNVAIGTLSGPRKTDRTTRDVNDHLKNRMSKAQEVQASMAVEG